MSNKRFRFRQPDSRSTSEWVNNLKGAEVSAWCSVSRGVVYELIRRNELPSVRLGRLVRVPQEGLARWMHPQPTAAPEAR
jgi:excisionase family DNA binding protein